MDDFISWKPWSQTISHPYFGDTPCMPGVQVEVMYKSGRKEVATAQALYWHDVVAWRHHLPTPEPELDTTSRARPEVPWTRAGVRVIGRAGTVLVTQPFDRAEFAECGFMPLDPGELIVESDSVVFNDMYVDENGDRVGLEDIVLLPAGVIPTSN